MTSMVSVSPHHPDRLTDTPVQRSPARFDQPIEVFGDIAREYSHVITRLAQEIPTDEQKLLVVPNAETKEFATATAHARGVRTDIISSTQLSTHPLIRTAMLLLSGAVRVHNFQEANQYISRDAPILKVLETSTLMETFASLRRRQSLGHFFATTQQFFTKHRHLLTNTPNIGSYLYDATIENIFEQLVQEKTKCSTQDALNRLYEMVAHSARDEAAILHIRELGEPLNRDYRVVHVASLNNTHQKEKIFEWLSGHCPGYSLSMHERDRHGHTIIAPQWTQLQTTPGHPQFFFDDEMLESQKLFLHSLLSRDLNNVNALTTQSPQAQLTPTSLETFAQCPSKFFYRHILHLPEEQALTSKIDPRTFGIFIHACLDDIARHSLCSSDIDEVISRNESVLAPYRLESNEGISIRHRAQRVLSNYFKYEDVLHTTICAHEKTVHGTVLAHKTPIMIKGKIDRIHTDGDQHHIVDYKTGTLSRSVDPLHFGRRIQLGLYTLLSGENIASLQYWHVREDRLVVDKLAWNKDLQSRIETIVESISALINEGVFLPRNHNVGSTSTGVKDISPCDTCPFTHCCPTHIRTLWTQHKDSPKNAPYTQATSHYSPQVLKESNNAH